MFSSPSLSHRQSHCNAGHISAKEGPFALKRVAVTRRAVSLRTIRLMWETLPPRTLPAVVPPEDCASCQSALRHLTQGTFTRAVAGGTSATRYLGSHQVLSHLQLFPQCLKVSEWVRVCVCVCVCTHAWWDKMYCFKLNRLAYMYTYMCSHTHTHTHVHRVHCL